MEDFVVTSRAPIADLNLPSTPETLRILENFDMYREVCTGMMKDAVNFAYLEHLMRISTTEAETSEALRQFPRTLQYKLSEVLELKKDLAQEIIHMLQTRITKEDVKLVKVNLIHINHRWDGRKVAIEEFVEGVGELLPVCYTLTMKNRYYLLYTPNMSYIDGYEAFDGSVKINYIPESTLPQLTAEFYRSPANKGVQTDDNKKKGKKEVIASPRIETKSAIMSARSQEQSVKVEEPKSMFLNSISGFKESVENVESQYKQERIEEGEVDEEEERDDEEYEEVSEQDSERPVRKKRVKVEKTWEKYEKKAAYQKRENSFNPCDCKIC